MEDEIGDGWKTIVWAMKKAMPDSVKYEQIKEKFGGLRVYISANKEDLPVAYALIDMAENLAEKTCEYCGAPGELRTGVWLKTLCDKHYNGN